MNDVSETKVDNGIRAFKFMKDDDEFLRHKLKSLLKDNIVEVQFIKKDGTVRDMVCTLDPNRIPQKTSEPFDIDNVEWKEVKYRNLSNDNLRVYDLEKKGWRSFRVDSVVMYIARSGKN